MPGGANGREIFDLNCAKKTAFPPEDPDQSQLQCEGRPHAECRTDALSRTTVDRGKWSRGERGEVEGSAAASVARYRGPGMGEDRTHGFAPVAMVCHPYRGWRRAVGREEHLMSNPASL